jgi:hypothetical protein
MLLQNLDPRRRVASLYPKPKLVPSVRIRVITTDGDLGLPQQKTELPASVGLPPGGEFSFGYRQLVNQGQQLT